MQSTLLPKSSDLISAALRKSQIETVDESSVIAASHVPFSENERDVTGPAESKVAAKVLDFTSKILI